VKLFPVDEYPQVRRRRRLLPLVGLAAAVVVPGVLVFLCTWGWVVLIR
jgi:hypothetical protein